MAEVPEGFPTRLTDEELAESIEAWSAEYRETSDEDFEWAYANARAAELMRVPAAELIGRRLRGPGLERIA